MSVQRAKGTQDLSPEEMRRFRLIEGVFRDCCLKWGYEEVRTPTLEYLHLFTSTGTLTPSRLGRVYSFLDWDGWSGERVVLRPDGTIPIARLYIEALNERKLAKLFYVTNVFSFEETGKESREKWQCGVELIGAGSTTADVELVLLALGVLKQLGLQDVEVRLSHADLIRALLAKFGLNPEEQYSVFDRMLDGDEEVLAKTHSTLRQSSGQALATLLDLKGRSSGFLKNLKALFNQGSSELEPALGKFIDTVELLEAVGVNYQIDLASGRGFEYYTGLMFKLLIDGEQIGGGGRYDNLIPLMGGGEIPASGFALYLDHLMKLTKVGTLAGPKAQKILIKAGAGALKQAFELTAALHKAGYGAEVDLGGQQPSDYKWLLSVQDKAPLFALTNRSSRKKFEAGTAKEVLKLLK